MLSFVGMAVSNPAAFGLYLLIMGAGVGMHLLARRQKNRVAMEKDTAMH